MVRSTIALAMAMGLSLIAAAVAAPADLAPVVDDVLGAGQTLPARILPDSPLRPILPAAPTDTIAPDLRGSSFPGAENAHATGARDAARPVSSTPVAPARPREIEDAPMAPLPPAVVAGPIGLLLAGFMARRANRRGGRV